MCHYGERKTVALSVVPLPCSSQAPFKKTTPSLLSPVSGLKRKRKTEKQGGKSAPSPDTPELPRLEREMPAIHSPAARWQAQPTS